MTTPRAPIQLTPALMAQRFIDVEEVVGPSHSAQVLAMLQRVDKSVTADETAWCSAFVGYVAWLLGLPRSGSLSARSWLQVGTPVDPDKAQSGWDIVILKRGPGKQPGPEVLAAPGHVGFFVRYDGNDVLVLGGNQSNRVSIARFPRANILGVRSL